MITTTTSTSGPRGIFTPEQRAQQADAQVDFIERVLELPKGGRVLDLCCGHGRHAVRLAQRGYRVTGLRVFRESDCRERPDGTLSLELRRYDIHTGRTNVDWIYVEPDGKRRTAFHSLRLYTFPEFAAMLPKAGCASCTPGATSTAAS